jgi:hypothetical protein
VIKGTENDHKEDKLMVAGDMDVPDAKATMGWRRLEQVYSVTEHLYYVHLPPVLKLVLL